MFKNKEKLNKISNICNIEANKYEQILKKLLDGRDKPLTKNEKEELKIADEKLLLLIKIIDIIE